MDPSEGTSIRPLYLDMPLYLDIARIASGMPSTRNGSTRYISSVSRGVS